MKKYVIPKKKLEDAHISPEKGVKLLIKIKNRKDNASAIIKEVKKDSVVIYVDEDLDKKK